MLVPLVPTTMPRAPTLPPRPTRSTPWVPEPVESRHEVLLVPTTPRAPTLPPRPTRPTPWVPEPVESRHECEHDSSLLNAAEPEGSQPCMPEPEFAIEQESSHCSIYESRLSALPQRLFGLSDMVAFFNECTTAEYVGCKLFDLFLHYDLDHSDDGRMYVSVKSRYISLYANHDSFSPAELAISELLLVVLHKVLPKQLDLHVSLGSWRFKKGRLMAAVKEAQSMIDNHNKHGVCCICSLDRRRAHQNKYYLNLDVHSFQSLQFFRELSRFFSKFSAERPWSKHDFHISFVPGTA